MCEEGKPNVIIDLGGYRIKAGFSGEEGPRAVFPSIVGRPKSKSAMVGGWQKDYYVGNLAEEKRGVLHLTCPIKDGIINNFDDLEKLLEHVYGNELHIESAEHNCMLTEAPLNPKENREKLIQIMFETFNVPRFYVVNSAIVSLYGAGKFTGVVVDSGYEVTHCVPIYDGYSLPHSIIRLDLAGLKVTKHMAKILVEIGFRSQTTTDFEIVEDIKKECCYVALDYDEESKTVEEMEYNLPDGTVIKVKSQRFRAPEIMFKPMEIGIENRGIHQLCYESINKCDLDIRRDLYENITPSGGNTMFMGFAERLVKDVKALAPESMKSEIKVNALPERKYIAWIGGSILSSTNIFSVRWIPKEDYDESGSTIVHRKCF